MSAKAGAAAPPGDVASDTSGTSAAGCVHKASALWSDGGWYRHAAWRPSPNQGVRPPGAAIDLVVLHSISLPPGEFAGDHIEQLFMNRLDTAAHPYFAQLEGLEVSAHFLVRRDGALIQFVGCDARAWHAGRSCFGARDNCNDFSVGIELEGLEGGRFEQAQYETLCAVMTALTDRYPIAHVRGHEHVAPGRKLDPGPGFAWRVLRDALAWPPQAFPPP